MMARRTGKTPKPKHKTVPLAELLAGVERSADGPGQIMTDVTVDAEIAPLVRVLNEAGFVTLGSCSGHGEDDAYVDLAVCGLGGMRELVRRINALDHDELPVLDLTLNWSEEVVTACDFEQYPEWVMLSLKIEQPTADEITALAKGLDTTRDA